jgi:threonine/homoserine/homoserine lactone efflux protein
MTHGDLHSRFRVTVVSAHIGYVCLRKMLNGHLLLAFLLTTAVAMIVPGPDMLFVLSKGLGGGRRLALLATTGVATGEAVHIVVAAAGLSALFLAAPAAFTVVRIGGALYLLYLGVQAIRGHGGMASMEGSQERRHGRVYIQGLLTNLSNPKMITFTVAFLPQFIDPRRGHVWAQFLILGLIFLGFEFVVDGTVGVMAARMRGLLARRRVRRGLEVGTGTVFIGFAARLAFEKR